MIYAVLFLYELKEYEVVITYIYHIATKISAIWLATRMSIFTVSVQGAQYEKYCTAVQIWEKKTQNVWFTKPAWNLTETTCFRLSHSDTFV